MANAKSRVAYVVVRGRVYADIKDILHMLALTGYDEPHRGLSEWLRRVEHRERL